MEWLLELALIGLLLATMFHAVRLERRPTPRRIRSLVDGLQTVARQWSYSAQS